MAQNLRQVYALVLQSPGPAVNLRQVHALVLGSSSSAFPTGKTALETLRAAILSTASAAGKALVASDYTIENPVAITGTKNTSVKLTALVTDHVTGSQTLRYDRRLLGGLYSKFTVPIETGTGNTSVLALLTKINALTGFVLETRDLVDAVIPDGATEVTLVAADTSYAFIPGSTLTIPLHSSTPTLASLITNAQMNGFDPA